MSEVSVAVSTAWDGQTVGDSDRGGLARQVHGAPDGEGWRAAQVAALHGQVFDLSDPDVVDQADEISEVSLAIATGLADDGDTVLALEVAEWFPALRFDLAGRCRLGSCRPVLSRLCDRVAYLLGLRLPGDAFHRG